MKRLIINADDFGYDEGVVRGIVDLHQAGVISSTSCLTNMPAWPQAAAYLREHPELGAGVHLVFNEGCPVLPAVQVPALVGQSGEFLNDRQIRRSAPRRVLRPDRAVYRRCGPPARPSGQPLCCLIRAPRPFQSDAGDGQEVQPAHPCPLWR